MATPKPEPIIKAGNAGKVEIIVSGSGVVESKDPRVKITKR